MSESSAQDIAPAWTGTELSDPHARSDKPQRVQRMFASIAPSYDLNNRLHSFGRDQAWRRYAVRQASPRPDDEALDVACGTGDLTQALARAGCRRVVGVDFTREMLDLAEAKRARASRRDAISYQWADAHDLPFPPASFDIVTIAFGIRNVRDPRRALAEFRRVLRPGGRLVILEFDRPRVAPVRWVNAFYSGWLMPRTAALIARDRSGAYRYLPRSVSTFMPRRELLRAMTEAGFSACRARSLTFGVCACYQGEVGPFAAATDS